MILIYYTNIPEMPLKSSERNLIQNLRYPYNNFIEEVSQLIELETYKKFRIILKQSRNIPRMSPKKFRKISHPEQEKFLHLSNFSEKVSQLKELQTYKKFRIILKQPRNIPRISQKIPNNFKRVQKYPKNV